VRGLPAGRRSSAASANLITDAQAQLQAVAGYFECVAANDFQRELAA